METIFFEVINRSISAGWLILVILLLRLLLRRAPRWTVCLLWGLVAIRLISPFTIESVLSLIPSSETISPGIVYAQVPAIHSGVSVLNNSVNPVLSTAFAPSPSTSANPLQILSFIASRIWITGVLLMLLHAFFSWVLLKRKIAASLVLEKNIRICDHIPGPFILGIIHPEIYIPSTTLQADIPHILAHEYAHIKRKDHWWKPMAFALLTANWFSPLMWIAYILLSRDIEAACDEHVIKEMQLIERKEYSKALLDCAVMNRHITVCPLAFGEVSVKGRIKRVLQYKKPASGIIVISVLICIAAAVCYLTNPKDIPNTSLETPFGHEYAVSEIVYDAPNYSFTYTPETAPKYRLKDDMQAQVLEDLNSDDWLTPGTFHEYDLSYDDFTSVANLMDTNLSVTELVDNNSNAWTLDVIESSNGTFYYLLQQNDGTLYFCLGYHHAVHDHIRWIFKLERIPPAQTKSALNGTTDTIEPVSELSKEERLEAAIHYAIIEHNRHYSPNYSPNVFVCENRIILDTMTLVACGANDESSYEETTVYMMVLYQEYDLSGGTIRDMGGSHMPIALSFKADGNDYMLTEYWTPEDGSYYLPSIQQKFPEHCLELATDTQLHILGQIQSCYDQAVQFANLDTARILDDLYEQIESSPAQSSVPGDYISAHPMEYREITYYGMYALKHAFGEFLEGGQTGLRGHLMALICQDILESMGEPFTPTEYTTGQEWFEQYKAYAYSMAPQIEAPYSSQFRPSIQLLLDME